MNSSSSLSQSHVAEPSEISEKSVQSTLEISCIKHGSSIHSCENCSDMLAQGFINFHKNSKILAAIHNEDKECNKLQAEIGMLIHELQDLCAVGQSPAKLTICDLQLDLLTRPLPNDLFSICENAESSLGYLMRQNLFPQAISCKYCEEPMSLQGRAGLGFSFACITCRSRLDYRTGTFWEKSCLQPNQILWFMALWVAKVRDVEISQLMEFSSSFISTLSARIRKVIAKHYLETLPIFQGIVEIDIKNFVKRKIEIGKSKTKERWVLIMVERGRKISFMKQLKSKSFPEILKAVQERCEIGTILITNSRSVYGRLEEYGYPHYKLEAARGFADSLNPKINISKAYGQWAWIKGAVKRYNRVSTNLDDHLNEFQWRRQIKRNFSYKYHLHNILTTALKVLSGIKCEDFCSTGNMQELNNLI